MPPSRPPAPARAEGPGGARAGRRASRAGGLDTTAANLSAPDGVVGRLSGAESRLLLIYLQNPNAVLSRDQLSNFTFGRDADPLDRTIDMQVSRLRERLREQAREPEIIKTVRGKGYVLAARVEKHQSEERQ